MIEDLSPPPAEVPSLPEWAIASDRRRAHIGRVMALIDSWAAALHLSTEEQTAWHDAAQWHDALRDAPEALLRELSRMTAGDVGLLHGPATAVRLTRDGETREDVLDAIRWHTVGSVEWPARGVGRALYMADFLEPGRPFARRDRAYLARMVPYDFDGTFREVLRMRIAWALWEGKALGAETAALWNALR